MVQHLRRKMVSVGHLLTALCLSYLLQRSLCLRCYCNYQPARVGKCPEPECTAKEGHVCRYSRYLNAHANNELFVIHDCAPSNNIVDGCLVINKTMQIERCCDDTDFCNQNYSLLLPHETTPTTVTTTNTPTMTDHHSVAAIVVPVVAVIVVTALIALVMVLLFLFYVRRRKGPTPNNDFNVRLNPHEVEAFMEETLTSGDGGGQPFLQQRTIAREIQLQHMIGCGKYGEVYYGTWRGEEYAVKVFRSFDEKSWFRETQIYNLYILPHENILAYVAADITSKSDDMTQLWLITHFHKCGSLYDHLSHCDLLPREAAAKLVISAIQGVVHLHTEIQGAHRKKPAIAHRDIKSKNILVKDNGVCCIADFGMAVIQEFKEKKVNFPSNPRQGTKRYMAPEVLDLSIDMNNFESFKRVDIYSTALVLWEICLKWETGGIADLYEIPFEGMVQHDPSFEEMREVVVDQKRRPYIPNRWHANEALSGITKVIEECWHGDADTRLTALRARKNLQKAITTEKITPN